MSRDQLLDAVRVLIGLEHGAAAAAAAELLPAHLQVTDLLRAADGVQQLARALDTLRAREHDHPDPETGHPKLEMGHDDHPAGPAGQRDRQVVQRTTGSLYR